jgi:DNA polymerase I-like protein with 3'-5' exonuclease and polymerase domains
MPNAARVYESDKQAAALCTRMSQVGFAFDQQRALEIGESLRAAESRALLACDDAVGRKLGRTKSGGLSTLDLEHAFFDDLGAPVFFRSSLTNRPSLGVDAMRGYAACKSEALQKLALSVLEFRRARKIRSTYVEAVVLGPDGRVHPSWLNYGAVSGRWACQDPNLMNLPRKETDPTWATHKGGVRSLYVARPGYRLVIFDKKQLEMRVAAYASGDEAMMAACESTDLHTANAQAIFGELFASLVCETGAKECKCGACVSRYALRQMAKSAGFAVCYLAEAPTVYARIIATGQAITLRQVEAMLNRMRRGFKGYYTWQEQRLLRCIRDGYTDSPILGRVRWLGHEPAPTECANFPIQAGASDIMNALLPELVPLVRRECGGAELVAQVHDSAVFEVPEKHVEHSKMLCEGLNLRPVALCSSGRRLEPVFPIDLEDSERWH